MVFFNEYASFIAADLRKSEIIHQDQRICSAYLIQC
ncbi:hypothetical protein BVRB_7g170730 [Beta vulgaris subsp. vulgaris]|nr:hypothetical protein BVRB_7g170730 [Beta vulgaris subsp. vulgaris]